MPLRPLLYAAGLAVGLLAAPAASASPGWATGNVNMRSCPGTGCGKILTIPRGARVEVYSCRGWCDVSYAGRRGFASGRYISVGSYRRPPPVAVPVPVPIRPHRRYYRPYGYDYYYDDYWYDRRWRRYHRRPRGGFGFEFHF